MAFILLFAWTGRAGTVVKRYSEHGNNWSPEIFYTAGDNAMPSYEELETEERSPKANGRSVPPVVEDYREKTVSALHDGADAARVMGRRGQKLGRQAGQRLDSAAEYVEDYDVARAPSDMGHWLKNHPGPILAAAAVVGFWFARSLRR